MITTHTGTNATVTTEVPTMHLRYVTRYENIQGFHHGEPAVIGHRRVQVLQQQWQITNLTSGEANTEWRDVPVDPKD